MSLRRSYFALVAGLVLAAPPSLATPARPDRILIVVSGEGRDQGKTRPGFEFDEFSQAYLIFRDNGFQVDVASPRGGAVEADRYDPAEAFNAAALADPAVNKLLASTRATADVRAGDYAAVYVVGGKGAMFDLPKDASLRVLLGKVHDGGGVVAAVCHGPAALADVRLADGRLLVSGRDVTGFSNEEEQVFGKRWAKEFPFLLEDALRARGARWQEAPLMLPKVVVDDRLVTGQNPYSTTAVAEAVVRATGRTPASRTPWRDEETMALVQRMLAGDRSAAAATLAAAPKRYHVELIGLLGYYQLQVAQAPPAVRDALAIMELALPHMAAPELKVGIADARARLGDVAGARALLQQVLAADPGMEEARKLMDGLGG